MDVVRAGVLGVAQEVLDFEIVRIDLDGDLVVLSQQLHRQDRLELVQLFGQHEAFSEERGRCDVLRVRQGDRDGHGAVEQELGAVLRTGLGDGEAGRREAV